jgi:tetratricopeptide (TPR) repeat protein
MPNQPFLGRTRELKAFRAALNELKDCENDLPYVFLLYGQGGIGKTKLAKEFRKVIRKDYRGDFRTFAIDWQERRRLSPSLLQVPREEIDPGDVLRLIYQEVLKQEGWGKRFDDFEKALERFKNAKEDAKRKRESDYQEFGEVMGKGVAGAAGMFIPGTVHEHGKEAIEYVAKEAFSRGARAAEHFTRKVGRRWRREDYLTDLSSELEVMARALAQGFRMLAEKEPLVIFFDTYEIIDRCDTWVREVIKQAGEQTIWVIGGRNNLVKTQKWGDEHFEGYSAGDEEHFYLEEYNLRELTRKYIKELFELEVPDRPPLTETEIERVQEATHGIPLAVVTAAEIYAETGNLADLTSGEQIEGDDVVTTMVNRYMLHCLDQEQDQLDLYALALANGDEALLHLLLKRPDSLKEGETVQVRLNYLERSFAAVSRNKLQLHQEVREFVIKQLFQRRKDPRIQSLNRQVVDHLQAKLEKQTQPFPSLAEQYQDDDWLQLVRQWLRHLFLKDETVAWQAFLPYYLDGLVHHGSAARSLIQVFQQHQAESNSYLQKRIKAYERQEDKQAHLHERRVFWELLEQDIEAQFDDHSNCQVWKAELYLKQSGLCLDKKDRESALSWAQKVVEAIPESPEAWSHLAYMYRELKFYHEAILASNQAIGLKPEEAKYHRQLGLAYEFTKVYKTALSCYRKAIDINPKYAQAWSDIGDIHRSNQQHEQAIAAYQKAAGLEPENPDWHCNLGVGYQAAERHNDALMSYCQALELDPKYALAWHNIGDVHRVQQQHEQAIAAYQKAVELEPENPDFHNSLGVGYQVAERYNDALLSYRQVLELDPKYTLAWGNIGNVHRAQQEHEQVIAAYQKAIELEPENPDWYNGLGLGYESAERYDEAIVSYRQALELNPKYALAWSNIGNVHRVQQEHEQAIAAYQKAVELEPENPNWYNNLGVGYEAAERYEEALASYRQAIGFDSKHAFAWGNIGNVHRAQQEHEQAIAAYQKAIELEPENPALHSGIGLCYESAERYDEAIVSYRQALELNPKYALAWSNIGNVQRVQQEHEQAIATYQKAVELEPEHPNWYNNLGVGYEAAERYEEALASYRQALELDPTYARAWSNIGAVHRAQQEHEQAIAAYQKAAELESENPDFHNSLGVGYMAAERYEEALASCRKALELNPKYGLAWGNIGIIHGVQRENEQAIAAYQKAVELEPENPALHSGLGLCYEAAERYDDALSSYRQALELDPEYALAWHNTGDVHRVQQQPEQAIAAYQKAVELEPENPYRYNSLGVGYEAAERYEEALASYRQALELDPTYALAWNNIGDVHRAQQEYEQAIAACQKAVELEPDNSGYWHSIGWLYLTQHEFEQAKEHLRRSFQLSGETDTHAPMNLGHIALIKGERAKALDCYTQSVALGYDLEEFLKGMQDDYEELRLASLGVTREVYDQLLEDIRQRVKPSSS